MDPLCYRRHACCKACQIPADKQASLALIAVARPKNLLSISTWCIIHIGDFGVQFDECLSLDILLVTLLMLLLSENSGAFYLPFAANNESLGTLYPHAPE